MLAKFLEDIIDVQTARVREELLSVKGVKVDSSRKVRSRPLKSEYCQTESRCASLQTVD